MLSLKKKIQLNTHKIITINQYQKFTIYKPAIKSD